MQLNRRTTLSGAFAILIIGGAIGAFFFTRQLPESAPSDNEIQSAPAEEASLPYQHWVTLPPTPPEDEEVFSYTGIITAVTEDEIVIETPTGEKLITITSTTKKMRRVIPSRAERVAAAEEGRALLTETAFSGSLMIGMVIAAESETNIRGQSSYAATAIIILSNPT